MIKRKKKRFSCSKMSFKKTSAFFGRFLIVFRNGAFFQRFFTKKRNFTEKKPHQDVAWFTPQLDFPFFRRFGHVLTLKNVLSRSKTLNDKTQKKTLLKNVCVFWAFFRRFSSVFRAFFLTFFYKTLFMYRNGFKKPSAFFRRFLSVF